MSCNNIDFVTFCIGNLSRRLNILLYSEVVEFCPQAGGELGVEGTIPTIEEIEAKLSKE